MKNYKIVIIGESSVGKSSLLYRFQKGVMDPTITSTIGAAFSTKKMWIDKDNKMVKLEIWDSAGQERYSAIVPRYFRGSHGIIIVYDVTDARSAEKIKTRWIPCLEAHFPKKLPVITLVGNKIDLIDEDDHRKLLSVMEDLKHHFDVPVICYFTSAITGENVQQLFQDFTLKIHGQNVSSLRTSAIYIHAGNDEPDEEITSQSTCC